jgi:3-hydroxyacyl-[acyl-carrier-protein] dehydratase
MRFLMIDRITAIKKDEMAIGRKNLTMSEDYFEHHFPFFPIMPGVLIVECMVQLAGWLASFSKDFKVFALLQSVSNAKFRKPVQPGDPLEVQVHIKSRQDTAVTFSGVVTMEAKTVATAQFDVALYETNEEEKQNLQKQYRFLTTRF